MPPSIVRPLVHWADEYYGDLYLDSVEDLLTPQLSALEAEVVARLLGLLPGERVLDLACGHGRHARVLAGRLRVVGVDRSLPYLRRAPASLRLAAADLRALPFADGAFDAAFSWYSSLFLFDDARNAAALAELGRVLRPGGRALVQHANPLRLAEEPVDRARRILPDGTRVEEEAVFDPASGVERARRQLLRPGGALLSGTAELRYYRPEEWTGLARGAGLRLLGITSTAAADPAGAALGPRDLDLVALLAKG